MKTPIYAQAFQTDFRSTSSYHTSYQLPTGDNPAASYHNVQFANGTIRTSASSLDGTTLADDNGFISTMPNNPRGPQRAPGDGGTGVPDTPLTFDWQVMLFMLLLCCIYILWTMKHHKSQISEEKN